MVIWSEFRMGSKEAIGMKHPTLFVNLDPIMKYHKKDIVMLLVLLILKIRLHKI